MFSCVTPVVTALKVYFRALMLSSAGCHFGEFWSTLDCTCSLDDTLMVLRLQNDVGLSPFLGIIVRFFGSYFRFFLSIS